MTNYISFFLIGYFLALGSIAIQGGGSVEASSASFFLAFMAGGALNLPMDILSGNKTRLEEFYLRPLPSLPYLLAIAIGRSIETVPTLVLFVAILAIVRGSGLSSALDLALIGFPVFFSMLGLGLLLTGIRLVFHKIGSLPQILWLVLLGTALAASTSTLAGIAHYSPFAGGLFYLKTGQIEVITFSASCVLSMVIGVLVFLWGEKVMFKRGLISQE
ncbi:hypothetical protein [Allomeiothermus silvanus]|uniref:hypothetical protein n=1 Tax=Allomeiothermus silvanus TaxID=52022 RepID=UPI0023EFBD5D|nr:hypothetical protein [Allomeiothermus silvanus]